MAENTTEQIDLIIRVIPENCIIDIPKFSRERSTDVILNSFKFQANANLWQLFRTQPAPTVSQTIGFEPTVGSETRFCDFTADDKVLTGYVVVDINSPDQMARLQTLVAEKENRQQSTLKLWHHPNSSPSPPTPQFDIEKMLKSISDLQSRIEKGEVQRKKDAEMAETRRKKDAEMAETQRKKDAEMAETRRKEDVEMAEMRRKTDQLHSESKISRLVKATAELEHEIKQLKQRASDTALEQKQNIDDMQRYIETLAEDIEATTDFLAVGDEAGFDRIKRRNLLDRAQSSLAIHLGLRVENYSASWTFREALGPSLSLKERRERLSELLKEKKDELPSHAALLLNNPAALDLLADRRPKVRIEGDQVAHGDRQRSWYEGSVSRSVGTDRVALTSLLDFIVPVSQ